MLFLNPIDNMLLVNYSFTIKYYVLFGLISQLSHQVALKGERVRDAEINEFPSVVSIGTKSNSNGNTHFCTGTLITDRHVLTARHCLVGLYPINVGVTVGSINKQHGTKYHSSHWITYNEWIRYSRFEYDSMVHDIAIITLNSSVTNNEIAKLSTLSETELYGSELKIAGWGITNNDVKPDVLKTALLKVISNEECNRQIGLLTNNVISISDNNLCSKAEPWILTDCGDSGGPSFNSNHELVGVTVGRCPHKDYFFHRTELLEQNQIVLHMNVNHYRDFINSVIQRESR